MTAAPRDLQALPKAHLHVHLEGAMRPATLNELATANGNPTPIVRGYHSLVDFGGMYDDAQNQITTWDDLRRVVREVVEDDAASGAVWTEPHVYPTAAYAARLGSPDEVLEVIIDEGRTVGARLGIGFGIIVTALRHLPLADAFAQAQLAAHWAGRGVVGFGLGADEAPFPPEPFAEPFAIARDAGLISAPHAGELAGPASVRGALDALGATRIEHGVRAIDDPRLVDRLATEGIVLDVCPTSNIMLAAVPSFAEHPLAALLTAGVQCSLNGDDPLLFGSGLLGEYEVARAELGLSDEQLAGVARSSLRGSGAPADVVARGLQAVDAWLAQ
jgi:adenosine deaminase